MQKRAGWTLVEMIIVIVVLAVLGTAVIPKLTDTRDDAYVDIMRADLNDLAAAMEHHIATYGTYPNNPLVTPSDSLLPGPPGSGRLIGFTSNSDVTIKYKYKTTEGYAAVATHARLPGVKCEIYTGNIPAISYFNPTPTPEIRCPVP